MVQRQHGGLQNRRWEFESLCPSRRSDGEAVNAPVCKTGIRRSESGSELYASLAQLVEHLPCKQRVAGSIPVGGSSFICIFAPAKTILDMAQTFFFTTCWRNSMSFAGRVMSEKPNRHHIERISSRPERS